MCLLATVVVTAAAVTQALGCKTPTPSSNMCTKTTIHHIDQADFYQLFPVLCRRARDAKYARYLENGEMMRKCGKLAYSHWGKNPQFIQKITF